MKVLVCREEEVLFEYGEEEGVCPSQDDMPCVEDLLDEALSYVKVSRRDSDNGDSVLDAGRGPS